MKLFSRMLSVLTLCIIVSTQLYAETPEQTLARARQLRHAGVLMDASDVYEQYLKMRPSDDEARIETVELLLQLKRIDRTIPHILKLKVRKPGDPRVKRFVALSAEREKAIRTERLRNFEKQLKRPNVKPSVYLEFARFLINYRMVERGLQMYREYLKIKPNDQVARFELAQQLGWQKRYAESTVELNKILAQNPRHVNSLVMLGDFKYWQGDEERAVEKYEQALRYRPNNKAIKNKLNRITSSPGYRENQVRIALKREPYGPMLVTLAKMLVNSDRVFEADSLIQLRLSVVSDDEKALALAEEIYEIKQEIIREKIDQYKRKLDASPNDSTALIELARFYSALPDLNKALEYYDHHAQVYPTNYRIRLERAYILSWMGRTEEAIEEFQVLNIMMPNDREARLGFAEALLIAGIRFADAESIFREDYKENPGDLRVMKGYAESLRRQGYYAESKKLYNMILSADSTDTEARAGLDLLINDLNPLINQIEEYVSRNPKDDTARRRLVGLYYDAKRYYEADREIKVLLKRNPDDRRLIALQREVESKLKDYRSIELENARQEVFNNPDDFRIRIEYAKRLLAEGMKKEAVEQLRMVVDQQPNDVETSLILVEMLTADNQLAEAASVYERIVGNHPENFDYRFQYAQILSWMGEYEKALIEYELASHIQPESIKVQVAIANNHRWAGDNYAAFDAYNRVLALNPQDPAARKAMQEINGPFFRGLQGTFRNMQDNEDFRMTITRFSAIANISLKMRTKIGTGSIYFEQSDSSGLYAFYEKGYYLFGNVDYHFNQMTRAHFELRYNVFEDYDNESIFIEIEHDFLNPPELVGLKGMVYYTDQDAVFDLASTVELRTWTEKLKSEKLGFRGFYTYREKWNFKADIGYLSVSDGNTRTDLYLEGLYDLYSYLNVGGRYDNISAKFDAPGYWSPDTYETVIGLVELGNSFHRWTYSVRGGIGKVLSTDNSIRQFSAQLTYRFSKTFNAAFAYSSLRTSRIDGEYRYQGLMGSITIDL